MKRALLALAAVACTAEEPRILSVDVLRDTRDTRGPYEVALVVRGVADGDRVEVRWSNDGGSFWLPAPAVKREADRDDLLYGPIPGQRAGTLVQYYVAVVRDGQVLSTDPAGAMGLATMFADATPPDPPDGGPIDAAVVIDAGGAPDASPPSPKPVRSHDGGPHADGGGTAPTVYAFRVLSPSGACRADSDCASGVEVCHEDTCRPFNGVCADGACPDGYVCDETREPRVCVIAPRPCGNDSQCPTVEECDVGLGECVARQPCLQDIDCDDGYECHPTLGLCFAD